MIPRIIIQTSRNKPEQYIIDMIKSSSPNWMYFHFNDEEIIKFFLSNPLIEFPNMVEKFYSFSYGEHRADLFRYYYLYVNGGVYFDTDAMVEQDLDFITKRYTYFSVESTYFPDSIFQGFIGCTAGHPIIYKALKDIYCTSNSELTRTGENFHLLCRNMYDFVKNYEDKTKIKLYLEVFGDVDTANIVDPDDNNRLILKHYHIKKIIPRK
tara:strand:- start:2727 stop:3356 length:630 start_codon:yes stop_codon:yes gene_type:complete